MTNEERKAAIEAAEKGIKKISTSEKQTRDEDVELEEGTEFGSEDDLSEALVSDEEDLEDLDDLLDSDEEAEISDEDEDSTQKKENLPSRLIHAAHRNGLSDKDIEELGDKAEKVLTHLADNSDKIARDLGQLGQLKRQQDLVNSKKEDSKPTFKLKEEDFEDNPELLSIAKALNSISSEITTLKSNNRQQVDSNVSNKIDKFFDDKSENNPELGQTSKLNFVQSKIREAIIEEAANIRIGSQLSGKEISIDDALEHAFSLYMSDNSSVKKVKTKEDLIKEAKKRAKRKTHRPSSKKIKRKSSDPYYEAKENVRKFFDSRK